MNYTKQQELAITLRKENIMVSAGAGAGKTRVLVDRMVGQIMDPEDPIDADRFLVMTFTNAAAAEMKDRIIAELNRRLTEEPGNRRLRKQVRLVRHAEITTIHSFCNRLIRSRSHEIGLDPAFRIGEEGELVLMKEKVMEDLLEEAYQEASPEFLHFVECFAPGRDDRSLETMIMKLYKFSRSFPDAAGWFDRVIRETELLTRSDSEETDRFFEEMTDRAKRELGTWLEKAKACRDLFTDGEPAKYAGYLETIIASLNKLAGAEDFDDLAGKLQGTVIPSYPRAAAAEKNLPGFEAMNLALKTLQTEVKEALASLSGGIFSASSGILTRENADVLPLLKEYIRLTLRFAELYMAGKQENNVYDFDDLEHLALSLLVESYDEDGKPTPAEAANELSGRYRAIYVDEYQDISLIQETILQALKNETNEIFTVGDVKQSIYRFRQARPDLFLARSRSYISAEDREDPEQKDRRGVRVELLDNFRSSPQVLSLVNFVFRQLMEREFGGVDYDEHAALRCGPGGPMESERTPCEALLYVEDENDPVKLEAVLEESAMIAGRIRELHEEGYPYSDMVILLRSKAWMQPMADFLIRQGIPALSSERTGYFQTREIGVVMSYLAIVDNVYQDIPMAASMLSSIGGFTEEDLARLRVSLPRKDRDDYTFYELMKKYEEEGEEEVLKGKITHFLTMLDRFRRQKKELSLSRLIWNIYRETGIYYDVQLLPRGRERRENLLMLLKKAEDYEKTVYKGLFYFNRYMDQLRTYDVELNAADPAGGREGVRIMTMHKSKGLEFPVVFVSGLSRKFNLSDRSDVAVFHPESGIGMNWVDPVQRIRHASVKKKCIQDQLKQELLEEELRVLYVAMTRAQKKLILTGVINEKKLQDNMGPFPSLDNKEKALNFMDWLLPVLSRHISLQEFYQIRGAELQEDADRGDFLQVSIKHQADVEEMFAAPDPEKEKGKALTSLEELVADVDTEPVRKAFARIYPHLAETTAKRKYSVSELKKMSMEAIPDQEETGWEPPAVFEEEPDQTLVPDFLKEGREELPPTMRGTIVHKVMELLPFDKITNKKQLYDEIEKIAEVYPMTREVSGGYLYRGAEHFLFGEYGQVIREMAGTGKLYKELPFTIGVTAPDGEIKEPVLVQGIIDLCGEREDGLWLLDYKTDRVSDGQILLDRYKTQMLYYKTALEQVRGLPVTRILIYSFALGEFLEADLDEYHF